MITREVKVTLPNVLGYYCHVDSPAPLYGTSASGRKDMSNFEQSLNIFLTKIYAEQLKELGCTAIKEEPAVDFFAGSSIPPMPSVDGIVYSLRVFNRRKDATILKDGHAVADPKGVFPIKKLTLIESQWQSGTTGGLLSKGRVTTGIALRLQEVLL